MKVDANIPGFISEYDEINPLREYHLAIFRIEGEITDLLIEQSTENLLSKMRGASGLPNLAAGAAAAYSGMFGVLANAGMLANYDGETVYNFVCHINGRLMTGQFECASELRNGDRVIAVVSEHDGMLMAHSLMNKKTSDFMMPLNVYAPEPSMKREAVMHGVRMTAGLSLVFFVINTYWLISGEIDSFRNFLLLCVASIVASGTVMFVSQFSEYNSFNDAPSEADAIFRVFGFPNPKKIDLRKVGVINEASDGWRGAFRASSMIDRMK